MSINSIKGFLSTGDDAAPGNFGLKDQAEALRWVQKNIEAFGGDSNRVTIFGESAGAMSAHFHILSPVSKGLFQAAISESGSALMPLTFRATGMLSQAERLADAVGCPKENTEELISCLRTVDVNTLMKNQPDDVSTLQPILRFRITPDLPQRRLDLGSKRVNHNIFIHYSFCTNLEACITRLVNGRMDCMNNKDNTNRMYINISKKYFFQCHEQPGNLQLFLCLVS